MAKVHRMEKNLWSALFVFLVSFCSSTVVTGDYIFLNAGGQPLLVVSSSKVAGDLLDSRATIYSDRPKNIVANDMMTGGLLITFTHYNDV